MRLSRHNMFMEMAKIVAQRGTCPRLCVGAVIVNDGRIVSHGYNGAPSGHPHCTDIGCDMKGASCVRSLHAEANALDHVPDNINHHITTMYVTHSPCLPCADRILADNICQVFFETPYKDAHPLIRLQDNGVRLYRVMPNGYIIDGSDGELIEAH